VKETFVLLGSFSESKLQKYKFNSNTFFSPPGVFQRYFSVAFSAFWHLQKQEADINLVIRHIL